MFNTLKTNTALNRMGSFLKSPFGILGIGATAIVGSEVIGSMMGPTREKDIQRLMSKGWSLEEAELFVDTHFKHYKT